MLQDTVKYGGRFPFLWLEILVTGTHGQTVAFSNRGHADDSDRKIQILHHSSNNGELLHILFAEKRIIRSHNIKQLHHHCGDSAKMAGPKFAAKVLADTRNIDECELRCSIHFVIRGSKDEVHSVLPADLEIVTQRPRITRVVLTRTELQRVNEDADNQRITFRAGRFDQLLVAGVQDAHSGD